MRFALSITVLLAASLAGQTPGGHGWPMERPAVFVDLPYPPDALAVRATGRVIVRVTTDASGRVVAAESLAGSDRLVPAVLANVKQWTLSPGARTEVVVYRFEIDYAACNDEGRSLFRLVKPNLAVITACSGPGRGWIPPPDDELVFTSRGEPAPYPTLAQRARLEGVVVLDLMLDAGGAVTDSRPLTQLWILSAAAVSHSKTWRFQPSDRRRGILVYEFALDRRRCEREDETEFWRVTADYWRVSACQPLIDR